MEPNLNELLGRSVEKALEIAEKTGQFVIDQAPELLQEFYNWHISSSIFFIVFSVFIIIAGYRIPFLWLSKEEGYYDIEYFGRYGDEGGGMSWIIFFVSLVIGSIMLFSNLYDLIFIIVSPKLYLIEYFMSLK